MEITPGEMHQAMRDALRVTRDAISKILDDDTPIEAFLFGYAPVDRTATIGTFGGGSDEGIRILFNAFLVHTSGTKRVTLIERRSHGQN